jgi:osmoprotectant transport system substrate-binding protein
MYFRNISIILTLTALVVLSSCGEKEAVVKLGSKNFTEQFIVSNIVGQFLESKGVKVNTDMLGLGSTALVHQAIMNGEIDLYCEYTGTGLTTILKEPVIVNPDECYQIVKTEYKRKFDLAWLKPLGYSSTWVLVMRKDKADQLGIMRISDLNQYADTLRFGTEQTFLTREDGYPGLKQAYGFEFKNVKAMEGSGLMYMALSEDNLDVVTGYGTDGQIAALNLVALEDDRSFFPPYDAAPVVRSELLERIPDIENVLNQLAGKITTEAMSSMCNQVDGESKEPKQVAREWLQREGLISG